MDNSPKLSVVNWLFRKSFGPVKPPRARRTCDYCNQSQRALKMRENCDLRLITCSSVHLWTAVCIPEPPMRPKIVSARVDFALSDSPTKRTQVQRTKGIRWQPSSTQGSRQRTKPSNTSGPKPRAQASGSITFSPTTASPHTPLADRSQGRRLFDLCRAVDVLVVRWVDRLGRNYDDVSDTIREFMRRGVVIRTVINHITFDGATNDPVQKAVRDALIACFKSSVPPISHHSKRRFHDRKQQESQRIFFYPASVKAG